MSKNLYPAKISTNLSDRDLDTLIIECSSVRRPLYVPSMMNIYGEVLCHSAVLCITTLGPYLVEFMSDNVVYVKKVDFYVSSNEFDFEGFHFIHDNEEPQVPERAVTLKKFAVSMANYMAGKKYNTFVHNCHHARYFTMKKYGMISNNPKKVKRNILFQGITDFFFRAKNDKKLAKENKMLNEINCDLSQMSDI